MQNVAAVVRFISLSVLVMMSVAALPPAKIGAPAIAILLPMNGRPISTIAATAPHTPHSAVTTTFHCRRSSAKSIVVPSDTMSRPAMMLPNPVICASSISVRGRMPLQKPASSRIAMLSTVENIALVFCAISSLTA